jgi:secretion/DNA translocation related TadE-like protein
MSQPLTPSTTTDHRPDHTKSERSISDQPTPETSTSALPTTGHHAESHTVEVRTAPHQAAPARQITATPHRGAHDRPTTELATAAHPAFERSTSAGATADCALSGHSTTAQPRAADQAATQAPTTEVATPSHFPVARSTADRVTTNRGGPAPRPIDSEKIDSIPPASRQPNSTETDACLTPSGTADQRTTDPSATVQYATDSDSADPGPAVQTTAGSDPIARSGTYAGVSGQVGAGLGATDRSVTDLGASGQVAAGSGPIDRNATNAGAPVQVASGLDAIGRSTTDLGASGQAAAGSGAIDQRATGAGAIDQVAAHSEENEQRATDSGASGQNAVGSGAAGQSATGSGTADLSGTDKTLAGRSTTEPTAGGLVRSVRATTDQVRPGRARTTRIGTGPLTPDQATAGHVEDGAQSSDQLKTVAASKGRHRRHRTTSTPTTGVGSGSRAHRRVAIMLGRLVAAVVRGTAGGTRWVIAGILGPGPDVLNRATHGSRRIRRLVAGRTNSHLMISSATRPRHSRRNSRSFTPSDRGSATIWGASGIAAILAITVAVVWITTAANTRHRAIAAADLAALAAATKAISGERTACDKASWVATHMDVTVTSCRLVKLDALIETAAMPPGVLVSFGPAEARARAGPVVQTVDPRRTVVPAR